LFFEDEDDEEEEEESMSLICSSICFINFSLVKSLFSEHWKYLLRQFSSEGNSVKSIALRYLEYLWWAVFKSCCFASSLQLSLLFLIACTIDGNRVITNIVDSNTIAVSINAPLNFSVFSTGQITYNGTSFDVVSFTNNDTDTVLVTTFSPHNYALSDIGDTITLYDTLTVPSFNGNNTIFERLSDTTLILPGSVLDGGSSDVSIVGTGGNTP
jgi:hypothetical protein